MGRVVAISGGDLLNTEKLNLFALKLSGNDSPVRRYTEMAQRLGGKLVLTEDGKAALAEKVVKGNTGYRMADSLLDELFQRYLFGMNFGSGATLTIDAAQVATI